MAEIKQFEFQRPKLVEIRNYQRGQNWPVAYILSGSGRIRKAYIGETIRAYQRVKEHADDPKKQGLEKVHIVTDYDFNQSAAKDLESQLIQHLAGHDNYQLLNGNQGLVDLDYYEKDRYRKKFDDIWKQLQEHQVVDQDIDDVRNSNLFKYSPYKSLTGRQQEIVDQITADIDQKPNQPRTHIVSGPPGTGKTILAAYLLKSLKDQHPNWEIGLVVPMTQLRASLKQVLKSIAGLSANMAISPYQIGKKHYDLLVVDEAHRLKRRVNLANNYKQYDQTNIRLGLDPKANQLDWVIRGSQRRVLLYDERQSIQPADIRPESIRQLEVTDYHLDDQIRVGGGQSYIDYIDDLLTGRPTIKRRFSNYDLRLFDDLSEMISEIKKRDKEFGLSRVVAGYDWPWKTKNPDSGHKWDIELGGQKLVWNKYGVACWPSSPNAINEVGCIHTIQGYDLNYAGVIIGPSLSYDPEQQSLIVDSKKYHDHNGKRSIDSPTDIDKYIKNVYRVLLTRGMLGAYIYVADQNLRRYLQPHFYMQ